MQLRERIRELIEAVCDGIYEREEAIRLTLLASIAGESVFLLGPPGVAKSLIARRVKFAFRDARSFEYLMGRFSTPEEIFGPISISKLKNEDVYERVTENYLPEADIVFLDEIWKASPPIQNALLTALNERLYRNGNHEIALPLKGVVAASNELPAAGEGLEAFWDRFLIRLRLHAIEDDAAFAAMVADTRDVYEDCVRAPLKITTAEYNEWSSAISSVGVSDDVYEIISGIRARIRDNNEGSQSPLFVSDRRWKKIIRLLRASALLNGRTETDVIDCFIIAHCIWNTDDQIEACRQIVHDAIRVHGYSTSVDPSSIAAGLDAFRMEVEESTLHSSEEEDEEPVVYDGEYLRVVGLAGDGEVRVWKGDYDSIGANEESDIELFHFSDDTYSHTTVHRIHRLADPHVLEVDGTECSVETERTRRAVTVTTGPTPQQIEKWNKHSDALLADCRTLLDRILRYKDSEKEDADANLFVPRTLTDIAFANLDRAAEEIAHISVEIEKHREYYQAIA